ncbi:ABC transporter permease [Candidatus Daviesbacteria bacterium]|nr:ABC transporter permease [Candidatus Daviesbacteria bacterium]
MSFIKVTKRNLRRTPYQALVASMAMFSTFLVLSIFLILAAGSSVVLKYYESKPQAIAFFKDNTSLGDVDAIKKALEQTGKVTSLKYISQDDALQIYKDRNKANPTLLEMVTAKILPASLEISAANPEDLKPIAGILKLEPVVDDVVYPEDVVERLSKAASIIRGVGSGAVGYLLIFASLIIIMVIGFKMRLRRQEIEIMKLLGASSWFIRLPFLLEGVFYGVVGAISAWVASYVLLWYFTPFLQSELLSEINILPVSPIFMLLLLAAEVVISALIGLFASFVAVRRYLKV